MNQQHVLRLFSIFVFGSVCIFSISFGDPARLPIFIGLIGLSTWFLSNTIPQLGRKYKPGQILIAILLVGGTIRWLWILLVPTLPVSDFQYYFDSALRLADGNAISKKNIGYTLLIASGLRIQPSILTGKIINAFASTLSILFLYLLARQLIGQEKGLIAAFLFSLFPSEILMVSVLGTEVVATSIGILTAFFIFHSLKREIRLATYSVSIAGILWGLSLTLRSSNVLFLPSIFLLFVITLKNWKNIGLVFSSFLVGGIIGLCLVMIVYFLFTGQFSINLFKGQDSFPFLSGTNADSSGTFSYEDANLYYSWPSEQRDSLARMEAFRRIKSDPIGFASLIPRKLRLLLGSTGYATMWSLDTVDWGEGNDWGIRAPEGNDWGKYRNDRKLMTQTTYLVSQSYYVVIWFFAFWAVKTRRHNQLSLIVLTIVISSLLPHIILEVQGRYHHSIMPFVILLASTGMVKLETGGLIRFDNFPHFR